MTTLRLHGPGALDTLDPACSRADQLTRLCTRQLFSYRAVPDPTSWQAVAPVPDLAATIPTIYNAGVGASHTSYVVHLRPEVYWDTTPPHRVTAHDVVRGLKRLCNPVHAPAALPYFTSTIRGMADFHDGYAAAVNPADADPAELAAYQNTHEIPGILVLDDESLVFELIQPALDFLNILALPCAAPAPVEYDAFVPGTAELRSTGPYRPARFVPGKELRLVPNPVWRPESDPVRDRNLDAVEVTAAPAEIGLPWRIWPPDRFALGPYLVLNTRGVLADVRLRRAVTQAIDKSAIAALLGGPGAEVRIAGSVIPPGSDGHQEQGSVPGDPDVLAAGGLTLTVVHPAEEPAATVMRSVAADLAGAGVTARTIALGGARYRALLEDRAPGEWDVAIASRAPDWFHGNGRVFVQPMFQSGDFRGSANYGRYHNPEVDELIARALASADEPGAAEAAWRKAESVALADAAVVPLLFRAPAPEPLADGVRDALMVPALGHSVDLSRLWLDAEDP